MQKNNSTKTALDLDAIETRAQMATPLEDTGHSQMCSCAACVKVWAHASGLSEARRVVVEHDVPALVAEVRRLLKIERTARWFAVAAMDPNLPREVGPEVIADLLESFGVAVAR